MQLRELSVSGAWEITPRQIADDRGVFHEAFTDSAFREMTGHRFDLAQVNVSVSGEGVLRGLHFAEVPPGQAKYVSCPSGTVFDVVVDVRVGSPTFGEWSGVILDSVDNRAVYIPEGVAHGFLALEPQSMVTYLCSEGWRPGAEHPIDAFDPKIAIDWPAVALDGTPIEHVMSERDRAAPSLLDVAAAGRLPKWDDCVAYVDSLREATPRADGLWRPSS
ncbi:DTDP-4-dehydrorhamnose 3,5-epimerase RmlC [Dietzia sp. NCCP-2495]|uniref:dTDP-4-dehydrorhamnose 3,5-epimerase n=1 Tax=Dietzia sp. NCCP-2495 TaxID=2934675 RepID=UPI002232A22E|nr:dTDP-4-dehydrorhamnose 3,5-epimerase [Dietzia sp. NCCP-2495]GLB64877.1 DTDP-4-dehydrorhamnose 3,5-epimerase RmlC [Dietzia sp. NCCP-2495]